MRRNARQNNIYRNTSLKTVVFSALMMALSSFLVAKDPDSNQVSSQEIVSSASVVSGPVIRQLTFGLINKSHDNSHLSRHNGLDEKGVEALAGMRWEQIPAAGSPGYWSVVISDPGLPSQHIEAVAGETGQYRQSLVFSEFTSIGEQSGMTPFWLTGSNRLFLPSVWMPGQVTTDFLQLDNVKHQVFLEQERDRLQLTHERRLNKQWLLKGVVKQENKEGQRATAGAFYINAANPHSAILPMPVDEKTSTLDFSALYSGEKLQLESGYRFVTYDNHLKFLSWQNPFDTSFSSAVNYPAGEGTMALAPDNQMQQLRLTGSYKLASQTLFYWNSQYARATQKESFLPYTMNPLLSVSASLPEDDLDGQVDTSSFSSALLHQASSRLKLEARWNFHERENKTRRNVWQHVVADATDQVPASEAIYNHPGSFSENTLAFKAHYRFPKRTRLTLAYQLKDIDRFNRDTEETREDRYTVSLRNKLAEQWKSKLEFIFADRAASEYKWGQSYHATHTAEFLNQVPYNLRYKNHPLLKQFPLANREQQKMQWNLNYQPSETWLWTFNTSLLSNDYDSSFLGLNENLQKQLGLQSTYMPSREVSLYALVQLGALNDDQWGRQFRGGADMDFADTLVPLAEASDPGRDWRVESSDNSYLFASGLDWQISQHRLGLSLDYSYMGTKSDYGFSTQGGSDISVAPLPDNYSKLHRIDTVLEKTLNENYTVTLAYSYERFKEKDWAHVNETALDKVLLMGEEDANEVLHTILISLLLKVP